MDVERLQTIIDWMRQSPLRELEISDGDFRVHLVRSAQDGVAAVAASDMVQAGSGFEVTAPSYGIVHLTPSPGAEPFVSVGGSVVPGASLCVIEAMKVFSPLEAERVGVVTAILVKDGAEVTAGQPIFRLG